MSLVSSHPYLVLDLIVHCLMCLAVTRSVFSSNQERVCTTNTASRLGICSSSVTSVIVITTYHQNAYAQMHTDIICTYTCTSTCTHIIIMFESLKIFSMKFGRLLEPRTYLGNCWTNSFQVSYIRQQDCRASKT